MDTNNPYINTYTGKHFHFLNPTNPEEICIEDIAHSTSNQCRFMGHSRYFYSVAQHQYFVSIYCEPRFALHGLLHDSTEAYYHDINNPLKKSGILDEYIRLENIAMQTIADKFHFKLSEESCKNIKQIDKFMLATEAHMLRIKLIEGEDMPRIQIPHFGPWPPEFAESMFLRRFYQLRLEQKTL